jgi:osmotically inducible protein OsmC
METNSKTSELNDDPQGKLLYTAQAHTVGGRDGGSSRTSDGRLDVKLTVPGTPGDGTNPEQLFAVGWSSCYFSALQLEAATRKVRFPADASVNAEVDLYLSDKDGYSLKARLYVSLPGVDPEAARAIADGGHLLCPYSKATHGNIKVETILV